MTTMLTLCNREKWLRNYREHYNWNFDHKTLKRVERLEANIQRRINKIVSSDVHRFAD